MTKMIEDLDALHVKKQDREDRAWDRLKKSVAWPVFCKTTNDHDLDAGLAATYQFDLQQTPKNWQVSINNWLAYLWDGKKDQALIYARHLLRLAANKDLSKDLAPTPDCVSRVVAALHSTARFSARIEVKPSGDTWAVFELPKAFDEEDSKALQQVVSDNKLWDHAIHITFVNAETGEPFAHAVRNWNLIEGTKLQVKLSGKLPSAPRFLVAGTCGLLDVFDFHME